MALILFFLTRNFSDIDHFKIFIILFIPIFFLGCYGVITNKIIHKINDSRKNGDNNNQSL